MPPGMAPKCCVPIELQESIMNFAESVAADRKHLVLPIVGMTCATCVGRVEKALRSLSGVEALVNLAGEQSEGRYDPVQIEPGSIAETVERSGYDVPAETRE